MIKLPKILRPKRRWLRFRMRTMLCAVAVVAVVCGWPHARRHYAFWRLQEYVGVDLRNLPEDERRRVDKWIDVVVSSKANEPSVGFRENLLVHSENLLLHRSNLTRSRPRMYVVEMNPPIVMPGDLYCQIHTIDRWGCPVRSMRFPVGYRAWPKTARFEESKHGFLYLIIETLHLWMGEKTRQFYWVTDNRVELLRREYFDGTVDTGSDNLFEIAVKPDWSNWKQLLASDNAVDQLRGLAAFWSFENRQHLGPLDETTRRRLRQLARSNDPWIREEATAALQLLAN